MSPTPLFFAKRPEINAPIPGSPTDAPPGTADNQEFSRLTWILTVVSPEQQHIGIGQGN
jgi:hypothetical protein